VFGLNSYMSFYNVFNYLIKMDYPIIFQKVIINNIKLIKKDLNPQIILL